MRYLRFFIIISFLLRDTKKTSLSNVGLSGREKGVVGEQGAGHRGIDPGLGLDGIKGVARVDEDVFVFAGLLHRWL